MGLLFSGAHHWCSFAWRPVCLVLSPQARESTAFQVHVAPLQFPRQFKANFEPRFLKTSQFSIQWDCRLARLCSSLDRTQVPTPNSASCKTQVAPAEPLYDGLCASPLTICVLKFLAVWKFRLFTTSKEHKTRSPNCAKANDWVPMKYVEVGDKR